LEHAAEGQSPPRGVLQGEEVALKLSLWYLRSNRMA
jgi:hypothetical protein